MDWSHNGEREGEGWREGLKEGLGESLLRHLVHQYSSNVADHYGGRLQMDVPYCTLQLLINSKTVVNVKVQFICLELHNLHKEKWHTFNVSLDSTEAEKVTVYTGAAAINNCIRAAGKMASEARLSKPTQSFPSLHMTSPLSLVTLSLFEFLPYKYSCNPTLTYKKKRKAVFLFFSWFFCSCPWLTGGLRDKNCFLFVYFSDFCDRSYSYTVNLDFPCALYGHHPSFCR